MSMYKPLYKDLSKSELLSMRESGMSNREIADSLAVSYNTVLRLIGKQPNGLRAMRGGATTNTDFLNKSMNLPQEPDIACLAVEKSDLYLTGAVARYRLHPDRDRVTIIDEEYEELYAIDADKLETFIRELQAIARNIENSRQPLEMW